MSSTFCGKDCGGCNEKDQISCPGCRVGPGAVGIGDCDIAKCCRSRGHNGCSTCVESATCRKFAIKEEAPAHRLRKRKREQELEARRRREYPILGTWLMVLFWLSVGSIVMGIFTNDEVTKVVPSFLLPAALIDAVLSAGYAVVLWKLSKVCDRYRISAISGLVCAMVGLVSDLAAGTFWGWASAFVVIVSSFIKEYQEYMGHAEVVEGSDTELAEKWINLWLWKLWTMIGAAVGTVLVFSLPVIGVMLVSFAAIATVVIGVMQLICLRASASLFRAHPAFQNQQ